MLLNFHSFIYDNPTTWYTFNDYASMIAKLVLVGRLKHDISELKIFNNVMACGTCHYEPGNQGLNLPSEI